METEKDGEFTVRYKCESCGTTFEWAPSGRPCPKCGGFVHGVREVVIIGDEFHAQKTGRNDPH